jgi:hypothetical protein
MALIRRRRGTLTIRSSMLLDWSFGRMAWNVCRMGGYSRIGCVAALWEGVHRFAVLPSIDHM